jgi:hypothetical protein
MATMMRNDQNSTGTSGMVLAAALAISSGVAFSMSGRKRFSSSA